MHELDANWRELKREGRRERRRRGGGGRGDPEAVTDAPATSLTRADSVGSGEPAADQPGTVWEDD
jgi:hypothetical protein